MLTTMSFSEYWLSQAPDPNYAEDCCSEEYYEELYNDFGQDENSDNRKTNKDDVTTETTGVNVIQNIGEVKGGIRGQILKNLLMEEVSFLPAKSKSFKSQKAQR